MPNSDRIKRWCTTGSCAFVGATLAILADVVQKGEVSAVVKISTVTNKYLDLSLDTIGWAAILVAFGVALSFVFDADTKKRAFYLGASIIAIVMTATPYTTPDSPESAGAQPRTGIVPARYLLYAVGESAVRDRLTLRLVLTAEAGGKPSPVLIVIHDEATNRTFQTKEYITPGDSKTIRIVLNKTPDPRRIMVRVEGEQYQIARAERTVPANATSLDLDLHLRKANSPFWLRRLFTPYKF